jgi:prepilin-type N-terminal cleavage/methylation domain-containing protein
MKKAFTIIELLVAVALLAILIAISGLVFAAAVKAYRTAGAATEIASKLQVMTQQLDDDFRGLRKDGEIILVWAPGPELTRDGFILDEDGNLIPDRFLSFDQLFFFANGNFQSYDEQQASVDVNKDGFINSLDTKIVYSNLARICYSFGRDAQNIQASSEPNPVKRMFCRTQHLITGDQDLPPFPDISGWNSTKAQNFGEVAGSGQNNFELEYQTMSMEDWLALTKPSLALNDMSDLEWTAKKDMLSYIFDVKVNPSWAAVGGPKIDQTTSQSTSDTVHQLFMQGVGQFSVQIWRPDLNPNGWFPEIDPDNNGDYTDSDYPPASLDITLPVRPVLMPWTPYWNTLSDFGPALKFTFTLYDSNGVFKDGKTFTHIVYLN